MSEAAIRAVLESRLDNWSQERSLHVQHANEGHEPDDGETFLRATLLPAPVIDDSLSGDHQIYAGVFQIDVNAPAGEGTGPTDDIVQELRVLFPNGAEFSLPGLKLRLITHVQRGPGISDGPRYVTPLSLTYRADTVL